MRPNDHSTGTEINTDSAITTLISQNTWNDKWRVFLQLLDIVLRTAGSPSCR